MHDLIITVLLGLALFKIVDLLEEVVPGLTRFHTLVTMVLAIAGSMLLDYSVFTGYEIDLREAWMGTAVTGLAIAGTTSVWRALFHWMGTDEGDAPEQRHQRHLRSAA